MTDVDQRHQLPPVAIAALIALAIVTIQALLVPLFAAPAANAGPRDLPVVVAGPAPAAAELLRAIQPGAFDVTVRADEAAADQALRERDAYGAFVIDAEGISLHTASAASPTVSTLLTQLATELADGQPASVVDVVPNDPDDPRGAGFATAFLPLALTSMIAGILLTLLIRGQAARIAGLLTYGVLAGLAGAAVLRFWLGVLPGEYLADAAAIGLFTLATAATVAGLAALLGPRGIGLGVLLVFLLSNALSGVGSAPHLLPQPWGDIGQGLPVGAGSTLLRSAAYFDWAGSLRPLTVLAGYAVLGLLLVRLGRASPALTGNTATDREPIAVAAG